MDLNPQPLTYQANALPTELLGLVESYEELSYSMILCNSTSPENFGFLVTDPSRDIYQAYLLEGHHIGDKFQEKERRKKCVSCITVAKQAFCRH